MRIGVPTEVMEAEHRVSLAPSGARELTAMGHDVLVQSGEHLRGPPGSCLL